MGPELPDPAQKKDLVVHRQTEENGEEKHRHEDDDRLSAFDPDQIRPPATLEHSHDHAERGPIERMFITAALTAMIGGAENDVSRMKLKPRITMKTYGVCESIWLEKSRKLAVGPPT